MTRSNTHPPENVPAEVIQFLEASDDPQLRDLIHYAQQLLQEESRHTEEVGPREGEEIVRVDDHGSYKSVIVERPDKTGEARGPFAYRVKWEPGVGDTDGQYRWHYLGRVAEKYDSG